MLREGGALPTSFFSTENEVSLWPHEIDYSVGPEIAKTIADRPGDVPVFFGFPASENTAEIDERTAEIVTILDSTMVHVVFLDDKDDSGKIEYGHFGSFKSIIDWSRSLLKVLKTRFVGEVNLHQMENVLVVVCRGQQIRISEEECREFTALIGENANDASSDELHPFVSCYFLNRELSIDAGAMDIYASGVWDILVGRLLKAFVLSREQHSRGTNSEKTMWMRPGIRIWKSEECFLSDAEEAIRRTTEHVLSRIDEDLRNAVTSGGDGVLLSKPYVGCPKNAVEADSGFDYTGHWSTFDAAALAREVENSERRKKDVARSAQSFFEWRDGQDVTADEEMRNVFLAVKDDPRQLFACSRAVDGVLGEMASPDEFALEFRKEVAEMVQAEEIRKGLISRLSDMAAEFKLVQDHYVGLGKGLFVFAAVTAMCGVTLWQVITLLGGSLLTVLPLLSACAFGALAAALAIVVIHYQAGYSAAEAYVATCRDLDEVSARRHNKARDILCSSVFKSRMTRRRNARLKIHDLLARIRDTLVRELAYRPAIAAEQVARHERTLTTFARRQRRDYLSCTAQNIKTSAAQIRTADQEESLLDRWKMGEDSFFGLWLRFCEGNDVCNAGHLPVSVFIPRMRTYMSSFVKRARALVRTAVDELCAEEKRRGVKEWIVNSDKILLYSGKAQVNNRATVLKRQVFIAHAGDLAFFNDVRTAGDQTVSSEFHMSAWLTGVEGSPLALAIHEVPVALACDPGTGVLTLRQAVEVGA